MTVLDTLVAVPPRPMQAAHASERTSAPLSFSANALSRFPWSAFAIAISITHVLAPPPGPLTQGWALAGGNPASWA